MRDQRGETLCLAVVRIGLGLCWLDEARLAIRDLGRGFFRDAYHWPALPESLLPARNLFIALVAARVVFALSTIAGRWARPSLMASAAIQIYVMLADRLAFHNYRYALALFSLLIAISPCTNEWVLGRRSTPRTIGFLWAQNLAKIQLALMYVASAGSKLFDPDWRAGRVISDGISRFQHAAIARGVPPSALLFLMRPQVSLALALATITTELLLAVGLFVPRLRAVALWCGVLFHLAIQFTTSVALYSWLMLILYALFAVPATGERTLRFDPTRRFDRIAARSLRRLDWLDRFTVEPAACARFTTIDRDGSHAVGAAALASVARAIPLLFPLWLPLELLTRTLARG